VYRCERRLKSRVTQDSLNSFRFDFRLVRPKENVLAKLREQMEFLRTSLRAFYAGDFAESARIGTVTRVLVHENGMSKPLLKQAKPNGLELPILEHVGERDGQAAIFSFAVSVRMGPTVAPAVDLGSSHHTVSSVGAWWNRMVFTFQSRVGTQLVYRRKQVVLILANKEGGAHVDQDEDPDYERLLTDLPLSFADYGVPVETPDLARFLTAQSGVQMLECLKRNFFRDEEVPAKWEFGVAPPVAQYMDQISLTERLVVPAFPIGEIRVTKRD
jgi:hypothetical protein